MAEHFRDLFCQRFGIPDSKYETRALKALLYPHARLVVPLARIVIPKLSHEDVKFVKYLGDAEDFQEAEATVSEFRGASRWTRSVWRNMLRFRVSGRKAGRLVRELYPMGEKAARLR